MDKSQEIYYDTFTKEETKAVDSLVVLLTTKKVEYDAVKYNPSQLVKFLRARKLDVNKAFEMFVNSLNWRKENNIDSLLTFHFPELDRVKVYYPHGFHKTDKLGRPIYIDIMGEIKIDELFKLTTHERMITYQTKSYERLMYEIFPACSKESKKYVHQTFTIIDLKKLSAKHLNKKTYGLLKIISQISQNYYPETLGQLFIINTGLVFKAAWAVCKGFLDEKTRSKILALGKDYKKKLFEFADPENVPKIVGGECVCEPYGCLYSDAGPWNKENKVEVKINPDMLIIKKNNEEFATEDNGEEVNDIDLNNDVNNDDNLNNNEGDKDKLDELSNQLSENMKLSKGQEESVKARLEQLGYDGATPVNTQDVRIFMFIYLY
jgi:hypothetical protein